MKKITLVATLLFCTLIGYAQDDINISFEADEGFQLGELNGQNDWSVPLLEISQFVTVNDDKSTDGDRSLKLSGNPNGPLPDNGLGLVISPILTTDNKNEFLVDIFLEAENDLNSSEVNVIIESSSQQLLTARVAFFEGEIFIVDTNPENPQTLTFVQAGTYSENLWLELKIILQSNDDQIEYFIDDNLIYTGDLFGPNEFDLVLFASSFNQTAAYFDNINISEETMSIEEASFEGFSFYPNPAKDVINLNINNNQVIQQVEILDITGKKVSTFINPSSQLNVGQLKAGNYFLKVQLEDSQQTFKFIKV